MSLRVVIFAITAVTHSTAVDRVDSLAHASMKLWFVSAVDSYGLAFLPLYLPACLLAAAFNSYLTLLLLVRGVILFDL